jgi:hypothetical protein
MTGLANSNSHSTFASNRRTLYKPKAGFSKARPQIADEPHHIRWGFSFCCPKVEFFAFLSDDGQQLDQSDNQKTQ